jgi:hypothetical protein
MSLRREQFHPTMRGLPDGSNRGPFRKPSRHALLLALFSGVVLLGCNLLELLPERTRAAAFSQSSAELTGMLLTCSTLASGRQPRAMTRARSPISSRTRSGSIATSEPSWSVTVAVELHERAVGIAPHLDAGVLELNEQGRLPRGIAREPIQGAHQGRGGAAVTARSATCARRARCRATAHETPHPPRPSSRPAIAGSPGAAPTTRQASR